MKTLIFSFLAIFTLSIILSVPSVVLAQEEEAETETPQAEEVVPEELSFDIQFPELRAKSGGSFEFKADLSYSGQEERTFDLNSEAPEGWYVSIQPSFENTEISAIKLAPNAASTSLKVIATPLVKIEPGEYAITIMVEDEDTGLSANAEFTAIVTATYQLDLSTKTGRLSTEITSGKDNKYMLMLGNSGSASIENISLTTTEPEGWMVEFDNKDIETLEAGEQEEIEVTIKPPEKTIAGDYMVTFNANSENSTDSLDLRVTVLTPTVWGWVGIGIIVIVIVGVAIIFARLGRR
ncbi:MAG: hypothetical protein K9H14_05935 [Actinomycetia bacterium]|nr:hypothetical protein [Actinomycetes bacterium]